MESDNRSDFLDASEEYRRIWATANIYAEKELQEYEAGMKKDAFDEVLHGKHPFGRAELKASIRHRVILEMTSIIATRIQQ